MDSRNNELIQWLRLIGFRQENFDATHRMLLIAGILIVAYGTELICQKLIVPIIQKLTKKTHIKWDDYLFNKDVLTNACHLIPPIIVSMCIPFVFPYNPEILVFILKLCWIYIIVVTMKLISVFLTSLYAISSEHEKLRNRPIKGVYQMIKLAAICIGSIIIISTLIDKNPTTILAGMGASAAILMLVFKDTITGLVAGVQLSANDMLRPGDWITMPKYGADGTVLEVTLTTVKVRNFDNTISTIPPYALVSDSFQNWRGMYESGGRRIKRSLNIDMTTVGFCTTEQLNIMSKNGWLEGFETNDSAVVNLQAFRHYLERYLSRHPGVNTELTCMVRQLQPTPLGLPVELYFFSANKNWIPYEHLQADIFEHVLAVLPEFNLKIFQSPAGADFNKFQHNETL